MKLKENANYMSYSNLFNFHAVGKFFNKFWHVVIDLNCSFADFIRRKETVQMVRQKLKPMGSPSCFWSDKIVLQNIVETSALK